MNIEKALHSGLINLSALAEKMWPDIKSPKTKLHNKINETVAGNGKQRMTEKDWKLAEDVIKREFDL